METLLAILAKVKACKWDVALSMFKDISSVVCEVARAPAARAGNSPPLLKVLCRILIELARGNCGPTTMTTSAAALAAEGPVLEASDLQGLLDTVASLGDSG
eukprot:CAMPEP_0197491242 /NCGR_PEP_ID=MMETSP1311-20131121/5562_1 /TAXON_ID=464262 /ORGANISM="Genus nov. species nov., Strain RCC856" /LENGTH=101 /DNA_ID=CAMNT_0043035879 /DNA_START=10 /DNA_END=312 /DNA_ORIENTATION=+